jgi:hypothetical protein
VSGVVGALQPVGLLDVLEALDDAGVVAVVRHEELVAREDLGLLDLQDKADTRIRRKGTRRAKCDDRRDTRNEQLETNTRTR